MKNPTPLLLWALVVAVQIILLREAGYSWAWFGSAALGAAVVVAGAWLIARRKRGTV
jgi:hypothetical protein